MSFKPRWLPALATLFCVVGLVAGNADGKVAAVGAAHPAVHVAAAPGSLTQQLSRIAATATQARMKASAKKIVLGYANLCFCDPGLNAQQQVAQAFAKKRGWGFVAFNNNVDGPTALKNAETMINEHVTFAVEFNFDSNVAPVIMSKFQQAHIPVIALDIAMPGAYFVGAPNEAAGIEAGLRLGLYAKQNWNCNPDLVILLNAPAVGIVSDLRVGGIREGILKECPYLDQSKIVTQDGGGSTANSLTATRNILTAYPNAQKILVGGLNDVSDIGAINAAEQLGRADSLYSWGTDGGVVLSADAKPDPHLAGSVAFWLEGYAAYYFPQILDKIAAGHAPPVGDSPTSKNALLVDSCNVSVAQAAKIPKLAQRVSILLKAKSGTNEAQLFCPKTK